jgi:multiple sugar transport system substrate-binding protein
MRSRNKDATSRREFLRRATSLAGLAACSGPFFLFPDRAEAGRKKLRILQWKHFVPGYDKWFDEVLAKAWEEQHDTKVIVDHVDVEKLRYHAAAEAALRKGHDLVMFLSPPAAFEKDVIDHREIYRTLRHHWGEAIELAHKSTLNPRTKKYFAFSDSYLPAPFACLRDPWVGAGLPFGPFDYDTLRSVGRMIRNSSGVPCGFGLAQELSSNIALHAVLWSFGGAVQNEHGQIAIDSKSTVESLKYVKALYEEAEGPEVLTWKLSANAKALLSGVVSCTLNSISVGREAERKEPQKSGRIMFCPALRAGSGSLAPPHITQCYAVWDFAENKEGAKQFLIDLVGKSMQVFQASEFCNFPCFPKTVPDLLNQLSSDRRAVPQGKYLALRDTLLWTKNVGHPGYATAAIDETFNSFVIPRMFAKVAKGEIGPEEAAAEAEREIKLIFSKWGQEE